MKALKTKQGKFTLVNESGEVTDAPKGTSEIRVPFGKDSFLLISVYDATSLRLSVGNSDVGRVMVSGGSDIDSADLLVSIIE